MSLFVHLTVVPTLTVSVSGLKAKFAIDTAVPAEDEDEDEEEEVAAGAAVDPLVGMAMVGAEVGLDPVTGMDGEQAARVVIEAITKKTNKSFFITTSLSVFPGSPELVQTYPLRAISPLRTAVCPAPATLLKIDRFNR